MSIRLSNRRLVGWLLLGTLAIACGDLTDVGETELAATTPAYKAQVKKGRLTVSGGPADSRLALRLAATPGMLELDFGDDGSSDLEVRLSSFTDIDVTAGGGADVVRIDDSRGAFTNLKRTTIHGGAGNDTLLGASGRETLYGDGGNDFIDGGFDVDTIFLGAGDDVMSWDPGDGSDVVEGQGGVDRVTFNGANIAENIAVSAAGTRIRFTRDVASITLDLDGVEEIDVAVRGGSDHVTVNDLTGTALARVAIDLAGTPGGQTGDALADLVTINGTDGADTFEVTADGTAVVADTGSAEVRIVNGERELDRLAVNDAAGDQVNIAGTAGPDTMLAVATPTAAPYVDVAGWNVLVVTNGLGALALDGQDGDDSLTAQGGSSMPIRLDGGDGDDHLAGGFAADLLVGGAGNDFIDGGAGADTILMGAGDDVFNWDPGDGSDQVDGEDGRDSMIFNGANVAEQIDVRAAGDRARFTRDIAAVTADLGGVEDILFNARGGADSITVNDLAGSGVARVAVDLAAIPGDTAGDTLADVITVLGSASADTFDVAADGAAIAVTGLAAKVTVVGGDPGLDKLAIADAAGERVNVNGSPLADTMQVFPGPLVSVTGWSVMVGTTGAGTLSVNGLGGEDSISGLSGVTTPLRLDGGEGDDTLIGGTGLDLLVGGDGHDFLDGRAGADTILMGAGDDTFVWDPGDASDVVEGEAGADTMIFNGANIGETIDLRASGSRLRLTRDVAAIALDVDGIEKVDLRARGGSDRLTINDLGGTAVAEVALDLGADATVDTVNVMGTSGSDSIGVNVDPSVLVSGLPAAVRVTQPDAADQIVVYGLGGLDTLSPGSGVDGLMSLVFIQD